MKRLTQHLLRETALKLVALGWAVFECGPNKTPRTKTGHKAAKRDAEQLSKWRKDSTLAVATGEPSGIVVLDLDVTDTGDGRKWLAEFEEVHGKLPPHPIARTPRGGEHHYFACPPNCTVRCSAGKLAPNVDVRGDGGYVIAPNSVTAVGAYSWEAAPWDVPPPPLPEPLRDLLCDTPPVSPPATHGVADMTEFSEADRELARVTLSNYVQKVENAKKGNRNGTLNAYAYFAAKMVGAGVLDEARTVSDLTAAALKTGLTARETEATIRSAMRSGKRWPWAPRAADRLLHGLNRDYFFALEGKHALIFKEEIDPRTGGRLLQRIYPQAFKDKFATQVVLVTVESKVKAVRLGVAWFTWSGRREYDRVAFLPGGETPPHVFNLWQGFAVDAVAGDCQSFLDFLRDIICNGDVKLFEYLIGWLARLVQKPGVPGEVGVVLQGGKGIGKSFFASRIGQLFGSHYTEITQSRHLTGNFNAHLEQSVLVFADEALWAGDKPGEGTLKALITSEFQIVERKGIDARMAPNFIHLILASNADWVVPASGDERRYFVLEVSEKRKRDDDYFKALNDHWNNGGREAFLHFLLQYDLEGFNVRRVPQTAALLQQKLLSLHYTDRWLLDCLRNGEIGAGDGWPEWAATDALYLKFCEYCRTENVKPTLRETFGTRLGKLLPARPGNRPARCQRQVDTRRMWGYTLATLQESRAAFEEAIGSVIEWESTEPVSPEPSKKF